MSDLIPIIVVFAVVCLVIAVAVWLQAKANTKSAKLIEKGYMQFGDWVNAAINVVVGVFLGIAFDGLARLVTTESWPVAILLLLLFIGLLFLNGLMDRVVDKIFPSGIRPTSKPRSTNRTPLQRRLSMPIGFVLGVVLARLGLDSALFGQIF